MRALVAWRILLDEKGRSLLSVLGIFIAILLIFMQLGFYYCVPKGGWQYYERMQFDLMVTSSAYLSQRYSDAFPRRRLYQAMAAPGVASVVGVYQGSADWLSERNRLSRNVFVVGFDPDQTVFNIAEIIAAREVLRQRDTMLVDVNSRPELGPFRIGRTVEIDQHAVTIGGFYDLGVGFLGLAGAVVSDQNFIRLFPDRTLEEVSLGLVTLKPGVDPDQAAAELRSLMPADTQVFTRDELASHETGYWMTQTSTGLLFGFGVIIAFVVGLVILNQTVSSEIGRNLPEYATLKAMGYTDRDVIGIVGSLALIMAIIGYSVACLAAVAIYAMVRRMTLLPVEMTGARVGSVLVLAVAMSLVSVMLAMRSLRHADPVDLF